MSFWFGCSRLFDCVVATVEFVTKFLIHKSILCKPKNFTKTLFYNSVWRLSKDDGVQNFDQRTWLKTVHPCAGFSLSCAGSLCHKSNFRWSWIEFLQSSKIAFVEPVSPRSTEQCFKRVLIANQDQDLGRFTLSSGPKTSLDRGSRWWTES